MESEATRKPFTLQLNKDDWDIIGWLESLNRGSRGREVKAAIRARMAVQEIADLQSNSLAEQIAELKALCQQLQQGAMFVKPENIENGDSALQPELIANVVGNFRPGRQK